MKKKKSVHWKTGDDPVRVQTIEWVEPEGDYYGGGSGTAQWGDSAKDKEALPNRNIIEEEEDLMESHQPKREFTLCYLVHTVLFGSAPTQPHWIPEVKENPERLGGQVLVEEAKVQMQNPQQQPMPAVESQLDIASLIAMIRNQLGLPSQLTNGLNGRGPPSWIPCTGIIRTPAPAATADSP
jgi:hypothetical protein